MEKIFFVKNGNLDEVNNVLAQGGTVKMIQAVSEAVSTAVCGDSPDSSYRDGDLYAYVVVSLP